ncbi:hypothetical protein [uncultured Fusobacterium sp.]|uniref:hypothetical protein n=1 Tax=uncultured Fusobacterium sp. TaxID=159267 RepID=UPI000BBA651F|nr:hypothetical protein [uncultured Fusobacterium sp.]BBA51840.1 hypothetical protein FV113G1_21900 [Fusobacterium varium]
MNKIIIGLLFTISLQSFSYDYFKEIEVDGNSKYKEFYITEDIYFKSKNDLGDIRILDNTGEEIPYVIEKKDIGYNNIEKTVSVGNIISETTKEEKMETVFKFLPQSELDDVFGNRIEIKPKRNFYFEYELLGSSNGKNWEYITYGEIYKTPDRENLLIDFPAEKYTYYKLITDLSKESNFKGAVLKLYGSEKKETETILVKLQYQSEEKDKVSIITIKTNNLPISKVYLKANGEFKRNYSIGNSYYHRTGTIFKVGSKENMEIDLRKISRSKQMVLEIKNGDSKSLLINEIQGEYIPAKLMFKAEKNGKYKITFGDENLYKPKYDLEEFSSMIEERDLVTVSKMNILEKEPIQEPKDMSIYYNIFIGLVVLLLSSFMIKKISRKK